ncbi:hypothetical protein GCM10011501_18380 [Thalassotalea profundi]|uniref:DUF2986 domain-containing protein n=1 Tax=Thalassotalea profundi TaxID=2036687 RepID=A0ABQ3IQZ7_9GAMM|nr:hypothetical protein GCM10011501_18380 [Thalassotalea profundi]
MQNDTQLICNLLLGKDMSKNNMKKPMLTLKEKRKLKKEEKSNKIEKPRKRKG